MFSSANNASLLRRWVLPTPFYLLVKKNEGNDTALKPQGWLKKKQFLSQACKTGALNVWKLSLRCKNHAHHTFHKDILPFLTRPHHPQHASPAPGPAGTLRTGSCQPPPLTSGPPPSQTTTPRALRSPGDPCAPYHRSAETAPRRAERAARAPSCGDFIDGSQSPEEGNKPPPAGAVKKDEQAALRRESPAARPPAAPPQPGQRGCYLGLAPRPGRGARATAAGRGGPTSAVPGAAAASAAGPAARS